MLQANPISPASGFQANMTYNRRTSKGPELVQAGSLHVSGHDFNGKGNVLLELA